jgi:hypothetical protein
VTAPVADVATGLIDGLERNDRAERRRALLRGGVAVASRHGEYISKVRGNDNPSWEEISGVGAFLAGGTSPSTRLSIGELAARLKYC